MNKWDGLDPIKALCVVNSYGMSVRFKKGCHTFKLSPMFNDRIYFYHKNEWVMDMRKIAAGKWSIDQVFDSEDATIVNLIQI